MTFMEKFVNFAAWPRPILCLFYEIVSMLLSVGIIWLMSHIACLKRYLFLIKDKSNTEHG